MFRRLIIAAVCGLVLALPALAGARPAQDPVVPSSTPTYHVSYGDTKYDLQNQQDLAVPSPTPTNNVSYGDTSYDLQNQQDLKAPKPGTSYVDQIASLSPEQIAAGFGTTQPVAAAAPATHATADDNNDGWQIATWVEGGVIAALLIGGTAVVVARRRTPRLGV
jgi:hypothetical protein